MQQPVLEVHVPDLQGAQFASAGAGDSRQPQVQGELVMI
jgi:hypothetical protein